MSACQSPTGGDYKPKYTHVEFNGCTAIQTGLYASPLTVAVNAKDWQSYRSGIFNGCTSNEVNHDTFLIGLNAQSWRIKNSWSNKWGEYGYIRLAVGNTCGICEKPGFGFKNWLNQRIFHNQNFFLSASPKILLVSPNSLNFKLLEYTLFMSFSILNGYFSP